MTNEDISVKKFLDQINIKSTKVIFVVFALISIVLLSLFFIVAENGRRNNNAEIVEVAKLKAELSDKKSTLGDEIYKSYNSSLLFRQTQKETDRFQTIYALKNTKNIYDSYLQSASSLTNDEELEAKFQELKELLVSFDLQLAESVNSDGKFNELTTMDQEPTDSLSQFLFAEEEVRIAESELKEVATILSEVQNQLFVVDNRITFLIDQKILEINSKSQTARYLFFGIIYIILIAIFAWLILIKLNSSVGSLSKVLNNIAKGELPDEEVKSKDELNPISRASNELVTYINDANQFAKRIGDGDFQYEFAPKSKQDALGNSLMEMRNRLQEVAREDKIRNWVNEGQAKFGEILRLHNDDLEDLGTHLINNLVDYLNAEQGALFVLKEKRGHSYLELLSAYAYNRKKFVEKKIEIGEGLAGQAFSEGKTIYLKDIRSDHYNIGTGLGESKPTSLLIVPLKEEEKIEGVIEIASLREIQSHEIEFIESIGESIASSLNTGKVNETTKKLLNETQEKAEEMKAQEEELRQNMEELAATQEQMERRNKELEDIQDKFDKERYLLNALLNSSNDRIYFKDLDCKFIRVSKSMVELFEKPDESEVIGKSDFDFGFEEHAKVTYEDEQRIIRTGSPMEDMVEMEKWDDGRITWVSTTKNPLKNLEGKTIGTFGISRDVTNSKQNELEMQKRKDWFENFFKFQSTGFLVLNQEGKIDFLTNGIFDQLSLESKNDLKFEDIIDGKSFEEFLSDIDYANTKDSKIDITLSLKNELSSKLELSVISSSKENEDGTFNIFLIEK